MKVVFRRQRQGLHIEGIDWMFKDTYHLVHERRENNIINVDVKKKIFTTITEQKQLKIKKKIKRTNHEKLYLLKI